MKKVLHIIASPRKEESRTLQISHAFLSAMKESHPDWQIEEIDLSAESLPDLTQTRVDGKYLLSKGEEFSDEYKSAWQPILQQIERFLSADLYLISTPMWNYHIPYTLKHYIDVIVQPKHLFRYTATGPEGLVKNKKMVIVSTRGGDYSSKERAPFDFQEPYLKAIFGLVGIQDITFIKAESLDRGEQLREKNLQQATETATALARAL